MRAVAAEAPILDGAAGQRAAAALAARQQPGAMDLAGVRAEFAAMMAERATSPVAAS
jgi:hypothetical protein